MSAETEDTPTALELVDGHTQRESDELDVYDVILAGVEHAE